MADFPQTKIIAERGEFRTELPPPRSALVDCCMRHDIQTAPRMLTWHGFPGGDKQLASTRTTMYNAIGQKFESRSSCSDSDAGPQHAAGGICIGEPGFYDTAALETDKEKKYDS